MIQTISDRGHLEPVPTTFADAGAVQNTRESVGLQCRLTTPSIVTTA